VGFEHHKIMPGVGAVVYDAADEIVQMRQGD